ncbi:GtrA family protein [Patescibacteria group bacterium]|nr:GtrA family protein [Patescibacteria group bacterium]
MKKFSFLRRKSSFRKKLEKRIKVFCRNIAKRGKNSWPARIVLGLPLVRKNLYVKQFIKFILVGGISTVIDFSLYILLTRFFLFWQSHYLWANFASMFVASLFSFFLNKEWTFSANNKKVWRQYLDFYITMIFCLLLYQALFGFISLTLGWYDIVAKALSAFLIMLFRFHLHKFWVFK